LRQNIAALHAQYSGILSSLHDLLTKARELERRALDALAEARNAQQVLDAAHARKESELPKGEPKDG
jgi:hypothetical protein